jgi:predicted ribosomally synthesized peptide with SipW-like signal peptide
MQKFGKLIALVGAAALLVVATVFGTMAYLQDTDTNTNTFTIGKVGISMTETNVDGKDASGNDNSSEARDVANEYHVVPGETYTKDPTIVVDANSEEAYVYMTIDLNGYDNLVDKLPITEFATFYKDGNFDLATFCNIDTTDWIDCGTVYDTTYGTMQYRFRYATTVDTGATDETQVKALAQEIDKEVITYGLEEADYVAKDICYGVDGTTYKLYHKDEFVTEVRLIVPGRHNVLNSVGAFVAAREMGIADETILKALEQFGGAKRRFETKGKVNGVWVVDDYAHHPTEIEVTLKAARQTQPKRLLCLFQPHRYTRTQLLFKEFCNCFNDCDEVILTDIYAASELPIPGITSEALAEGISKATGKEVTYIAKLPKAEEYLEAKATAGDLILTVGAGDVFKVGEELVKELERKNK